MRIYIEQINKLRELSGNTQIEYLKSIKNDVLREILEYTYDPMKKYKIDELKLALVSVKRGLIKRKLNPEFTLENWNSFKEMLDKLVDKRASSLEDVKQMKYFITGFSSLDVQQLLALILTKDLRLNMGIKKFQEVWPDFCNYGQVQLAEDYTGQEFELGLYSRKFDGKRMLVIGGEAKSRYGKNCKVAPIEHILSELKSISKNLVFDGELLYFNEDGSEDFQRVISLSGSDLRKPECQNIYYVIFDILTLEDWNNQKATINFGVEYENIQKMLKSHISNKFGYSVLDTVYPHILLARQDYDNNILQQERISKHWEGLMYRNALVPYQFKRTKNLLKIKDMQDGEFKILGYASGSGRNTNRLGTMYIEVKGNKVGVGSGFTDNDREVVWNNLHIFVQDDFQKNFYAKIQYFSETKDASGQDSLRFPVFLCFRDRNTNEEFTVNQVLSLYTGVPNE